VATVLQLVCRCYYFDRSFAHGRYFPGGFIRQFIEDALDGSGCRSFRPGAAIAGFTRLDHVNPPVDKIDVLA
jgi:hypothetical protein